MSYLVLVRHGESEYNAKGVWTGWQNPALTELGKKEAAEAGERLNDIHFDYAFVSALKRAEETLDIILHTLGQAGTPIDINKALNERSYGDYEGKNKWEIKAQVGDEVFQKIRREWDYPVPNGETLKMVFERVVPYYEKEILPKIKENKNVLVAASGNSLRALVKYLESVPDDKIPFLEIATGEVYVYEMDKDGKIINKEIRKAEK
jgi:2,3-bisphosphoglycerate-dependent phosphoglycerate mutase